ncbi:alpha/beta hydrolase [Embleya sp. NBC_00896]|uniref:alpha/beta hydrolase n=1 Tax=Embleya sp. NBC_00896 TaxID=2975961 RepID=UPI00387003BB|nr:alpha/beta hydrolase [Embleya sp. NBC_00896]
MKRISRVGLIGRAIPVVLAVAVVASCTVASDLGDAVDGNGRSTAAPGGSGAKAPATPGDPNPGLTRFYTQRPAWKPCESDDEDQRTQATTFRCATFTVPLDYARPAGKTIDIAVTRKTAAKPGQRIGSLLLNPGGPGGSGVEAAWWMASDTIGKPLLDAYDIVGFDPRGVDRSAPVKCMTDRERDAYVAEDLPDDPAQAEVRAKQREKNYAAECQSRSGELLPFVGTDNAARDMDILRAALGDEKLNYIGFSYGTYLGATYAERFPGRTGRLVLDGAVDPAADGLSSSVDQQVGFDRSLRRFAEDCAKRPGCALGTDPATAPTKVADFLDGLQDKPLRSRSGRQLTSSLGWIGAVSLLYGDKDTAWKYLRDALSDAMVRNSPDALLFYADNYNGRDEEGHYDNSADAFIAIGCADGSGDAPTPEQVQAALARLKREAPLLSRDVAADDLAGESCEAWPFKSPAKPHAIRAQGSAPILVVGTTGDPATPYASAEKLAAQLADATLLTFEGEGHTAYGGNSTCVDEAIEGFLLKGTMPAKGKRCS